MAVIERRLHQPLDDGPVDLLERGGSLVEVVEALQLAERRRRRMAPGAEERGRSPLQGDNGSGGVELGTCRT